MDFNLSDEQRQIQELARTYAAKEMRAVAREIERTGEPLSRDHLRRYAEMGFLGVNLDREYGGHGMSDLEALLVLEEFAKIHPAIAFPIFESTVGPIKAIERFAPERLKRELIPRVTSGELTVAVAMSEPEAGSALTDLTTRAEQRGGEIILNGKKRWCRRRPRGRLSRLLPAVRYAGSKGHRRRLCGEK
jgi:Acyl-CoA dehydrogenases